MSEKYIFENSLSFVVKYFHPLIFSKKRRDKDLEAIIGKRDPFIFLSAPRKIAAAAITVTLVASASYLFFTKSAEPKVSTQESVQQISQPELQSASKIEVEHAVVDFTDAPLDKVIEKIEETYGVEIINIPDKNYKLTLHYEGNAEELISLINELLATNLQIDDNKK